MLRLPRRCPVCKQPDLDFDIDSVTCNSCRTYTKHLNYIQRLQVWSRGKWWWWRIPILIWFGVMLIRNWQNFWFALNRGGNPFSALDFGMHELGHLLFQPFGEFITIAGGSIMQCLFPIMGIFAFMQIRWYFASFMCLPWLGFNLFDVAGYAGDARARNLPLGGWGALAGDRSDQAYDKSHDWYQMLSRTHHLQDDLLIAHWLRIAGTVAFVLGIFLGSLLVLYMLQYSVRQFAAKRRAAV